MILNLDAGNSRLKWRLEVAGSAKNGAVSYQNWMDELVEVVAGLAPVKVRVASVKGQDFDNALSTWCEKNWGLEVEFAVVFRDGFKIKPSYTDISQLGVDRWLAMLAAYERCKCACTVMSWGTAITIDYLDNAGQHLGGYIVPGVASLFASLNIKTAAVSVEKTMLSRDTHPGNNTVECVVNGLSLMMKSLIKESLLNVPSSSQNPIFVVGGDADQFRALMSGEMLAQLTFAPELVFEGLAIAVPTDGARA